MSCLLKHFWLELKIPNPFCQNIERTSNKKKHKTVNLVLHPPPFYRFEATHFLSTLRVKRDISELIIFAKVIL